LGAVKLHGPFYQRALLFAACGMLRDLDLAEVLLQR
jgi:hypothetical protein